MDPAKVVIYEALSPGCSKVKRRRRIFLLGQLPCFTGEETEAHRAEKTSSWGSWGKFWNPNGEYFGVCEPP